MVLQHA
ncbi:hypothetical protein VCHC55B2_3679A, partial [Vibrio cholerae HC-55B2]